MDLLVAALSILFEVFSICIMFLIGGALLFIIMAWLIELTLPW